MLIKQENQKSMIFVTIGIFLDKGFKFQPDVCNGCHDVLMIFMNLSNVAFLIIYSSDYFRIISRSSKSETITLMQNIDSTKKHRALST